MSESSQWDRNERKYKNFECPCGKSYMSYPALYTHIKQSHGGKAPGQIKRPDTHNRGRPKASGANKLQQHNKFIQSQQRNDPIPQLVQLVQSIPQQILSKNRQIKQLYIHQPVYKLIMNDKDKQFNPPYLKQDRIYDVKMGEGIIKFFTEIQQRIENKNIYDEIVMLIVLLSEHIIEETEDQNVLSLGTIGLIPEFVNYFVIHDFRKPIERLKLEKYWIFQPENAVLVLNLLFKWMLYKKYTLTKVLVNERYFNINEIGSDSQLEQQGMKRIKRQKGDIQDEDNQEGSNSDNDSEQQESNDNQGSEIEQVDRNQNEKADHLDKYIELNNQNHNLQNDQ